MPLFRFIKEEYCRLANIGMFCFFGKSRERLLKYVAINTPCDETSNTTPSSKCQFDLANLLKDEMQLLGVSDIHLTEHCFLYGKLPATKGYENAPALGFIAHIDTVSDYCEHAIHPVITENYNGKDLPLGSSGLILSPDMFEHLKALTGHTPVSYTHLDVYKRQSLLFLFPAFKL